MEDNDENEAKFGEGIKQELAKAGHHVETARPVTAQTQLDLGEIAGNAIQEVGHNILGEGEHPSGAMNASGPNQMVTERVRKMKGI